MRPPKKIHSTWFLFSRMVAQDPLPRLSRGVLVAGLCLLQFLPSLSEAQRTSEAPKRRGQTANSANSNFRTYNEQLAVALAQVRGGDLQNGIGKLYSLSRQPGAEPYRMQIRYILGTSLQQLGLHQVAAFQFVEVIKDGKNPYVRQAIEQLSVAADYLGDDTLLNYATSRVELGQIPAGRQDLVSYRLGEAKMRARQFGEAAQLFSRIGVRSRYYWQAAYRRGLALAESGQPAAAARVFQDIVQERGSGDVTDTIRVSAQMGLARSLYQAKDFERSLQVYRSIPRDHELWHDALFESSWAMLQSGRFRSALSNFQSLHSAYYEDSFNPESLLLRGIVYLYICKYDEMDKTLGLFDRLYGDARRKMGEFLNKNSDPLVYFAELEKHQSQKRQSEKSQSEKRRARLLLPASVLRELSEQSDIRRALGYLQELREERTRLDGLSTLQRGRMGPIARRILVNRMRNARTMVGEMMKAHMVRLRAELADFYEQASFLRYEMTNGRKEILRKRIAGKALPPEVDQDLDRTFYVQNGYEYWPFRGEYWLDEIGNFQYVGRTACE